MEDYKNGYAATPAPLVVKDKVIVGSSGGENPTRGFIQAFDAKTGKRLWRFYTIPESRREGQRDVAVAGRDDSRRRGGVGDRHVRSGTRTSSTSAPATRIPTTTATSARATTSTRCSIVALDADTGELKWHYQFTPHDTHDWDSNHIPVLADVQIGGQPRKVVMIANRNGFFYALDRATGKLLVAKPFTEHELGARDRRRRTADRARRDGTKKCLPDFWGGTNFMPPSYDPGAESVFRHGARDVRHVFPREAGDQGRAELRRRRRPPCRRSHLRLRRACARSIRRRALASGSCATRRRRWPASCPRRPGWCLPATMKEISWPSTRAPGSRCGTIRRARRSGARPRRLTCSTAGSMCLIPSGTTLVAFALPKE